MLLDFVLGSIALTGTAFTAGLLVVVIGIRRGDHGKRLTGQPGSNCEAITRRLLTGSRGYDAPRDVEEDR